MTSNSALPAQSDPDWLDRLINEQEAANFLGFSVRALQNWRLRGGGPEYVRVSRRSVRYRRRELMRWADDKLEPHTAARDLPEEQPPAGPARTAATAGGAGSKPASQRTRVTSQTAQAPAKANAASGTEPAQTEPASKPSQERQRNPFLLSTMMRS